MAAIDNVVSGILFVHTFVYFMLTGIVIRDEHDDKALFIVLSTVVGLICFGFGLANLLVR